MQIQNALKKNNIDDLGQFLNIEQEIFRIFFSVHEKMLLYLEMSKSKFTSKYAVTNTIKKVSRQMGVRIRYILVWKMRLPPCRHFYKENYNKHVKIIEN